MSDGNVRVIAVWAMQQVIEVGMAMLTISLRRDCDPVHPDRDEISAQFRKMRAWHDVKESIKKMSNTMAAYMSPVD